MFYEAGLPETELVMLRRLLGAPLDALIAGAWDAELRTSDLVIRVLPDEVSTPDSDHLTGTVDRPMIRMETVTRSANDQPILVERLGTVEDINIISTLVTHSVTQAVPEQQIRSATIPAGTAYQEIYHHPSRLTELQALLPRERALIALDKAVELVTERYSSIVLYTRGYFIIASLNGLPDQEWANMDVYERRSLRGRLPG
jgi:hypothetical protein